MNVPDPQTTSQIAPVEGIRTHPRCFGDKFKTRADLVRPGVHGHIRAGIHGDPNPDGGAFSICMSGGYEDNKDLGDKIIYVGSGGKDEDGKQIADQSWSDFGNEALRISSKTKRPVRVIRGKNEPSIFAPGSGFRYDGLYIVDSATMKQGRSRFNMCFFELRRIMEDGDGPLPARRSLTTEKLKRIRKETQRS